MKVTNFKVTFDGRCFPMPGKRMDDLAWRLIHGDDNPSKIERILAASVISAYRYMIFEDPKDRNYVCKKIKVASKKYEKQLNKDQ